MTISSGNIGSFDSEDHKWAVSAQPASASDGDLDVVISEAGKTVTIILGKEGGNLSPTKNSLFNIGLKINEVANGLLWTSTTDEGAYINNEFNSVLFTGGEDIVLDVTWSEPVEFDEGFGNFELEDVPATIGVRREENLVTRITWDNVPLWPVSDGDLLTILASAVSSLGTAEGNLEESWRYDEGVDPAAWLPYLGD